MSADEPLAALLRHLEQCPTCPLPAPLVEALRQRLRRSRAERDRLLNLAADALDPAATLGRWQRAQQLAVAVSRFTRPENRCRSGRRPPADEVERLLLAADGCGIGLPGSARRLWDALR